MPSLAEQIVPALSRTKPNKHINRRSSSNGIAGVITVLYRLAMNPIFYVYHRKISFYAKLLTMLLIPVLLFAGGVYWQQTGGWEHYGADISESVRTVIGADNMDIAEKYIFKYKDKYNRLVYLITNEEPVVVRQTDEVSSRQFRTKGITKPINFKSILMPEKEGEGQWVQRPGGYYMTFIRPDLQRPYAMVYLYWFGKKDFDLSIMCGTGDPGRGTGRIPFDKLPLLASAFSGGFRYQHGGFGLVQEGKVYAQPLLTHRSKIFGPEVSGIYICNDSVWVGPHIPELTGKWHSMRQNLTRLVKEGKPEMGNIKWGWTVSGSVYTRRSAIGVDQSGNMIYALGDNLSGQTLAIALSSSGVWNAIHLDMNPGNVHFATFAWNDVDRKPIVVDKFNYYPNCFLNTMGRDFFYITRKSKK